MKEAVEQAGRTYTELQDRLFEAYLEERVDPIIGIVKFSIAYNIFLLSHVYIKQGCQ